MDDRPDEPAALVIPCTSCLQLHPDGFRCPCIIARSEALAELAHQHRRSRAPFWRRPRPWFALSTAARQDATLAALDLVEALDGAGWRMVSSINPARHDLREDVSTPPTGAFPVPNAARSVLR